MTSARQLVDELLEQVRELPPLQQLMLELDCALTGNTPQRVASQLHHYPDTIEKWLEEPGGNPVWYLSDGGYSRVVWDPCEKTLFLTYNSTPPVVARWDAALPQREALLNYLTREYARLEGEPVEEAKSPDIKKLKDNRTELDPAERRKVMAAKAVWHKGPGGKESPAVWKAVVNGKTWYVCNTHRCYRASRSIRRAISDYKFIKTTA